MYYRYKRTSSVTFFLDTSDHRGLVCSLHGLKLYLGTSAFITFTDAEWIDDWFELTYPYWTQNMTKEEEPLYLPSIPKANDPEYGSNRGMLVIPTLFQDYFIFQPRSIRSRLQRCRTVDRSLCNK